MLCREITDKNIWESFFDEIEDKTFLQSWDWGEFQKKMQNKIWRIGVFDDKNLLAIALVVKIIARRGNFLLIQHGPNIKAKSKKQKEKILEVLLKKLKEIGKKEKVNFIRINPLFEDNEENRKILKELGFRNAPMHANAYENTWKLNIMPSEDELLANMRKTTRYLIRKTAKNSDILIEKSEKLEDIALFNNLNQEVSKRQGFVPFSNEFTKNEFEVFLNEKQATLFLGKYKSEVAAGALLIFWSGVGFYHQAASRQKYANLSIPYLIAWEAIKEAKKRNCKWFDFWGYVDPFLNKDHPWAGPTLFKMGFGGKKREYVKTQDFPLSLSYFKNWTVENLRRKKRHL